MLELASSSCKITQRYVTWTYVLMSTGFSDWSLQVVKHILHYTVHWEHEMCAAGGFNPRNKTTFYSSLWHTLTPPLLIRKYYVHIDFSRLLPQDNSLHALPRAQVLTYLPAQISYVESTQYNSYQVTPKILRYTAMNTIHITCLRSIPRQWPPQSTLMDAPHSQRKLLVGWD